MSTQISPTNTASSAHNAQVMSISRVVLNHYRNYPQLCIEPGENSVVLTGKNGAGKTNILEAISMLVPGRGLRKAKLSEIDHMRAGQPWVVSATIQGMQGECDIGTAREKSDSLRESAKRIVKIDGEHARSQTELGRHLSMLWLTPQMEQLFNQGTSEGRRFLDRLVYSFNPDHAARVNKYEHAMRERNRLMQQGMADPYWLDTLEQTMAEHATAIAQARLDTLASLNHAIGLSARPFPKAKIEVTGTVEALLASGLSALDTEESYKNTLQINRNQDAGAGRALLGTHRTTLDVFHLEKNLPAASCSTGEQKALLLSIVLAQARAASLWKQVVPILLFDDVAAHLDGTRKCELFEEIGEIGAQAWMTGTDCEFFSDLGGKVLFFHVDNDRIR